MGKLIVYGASDDLIETGGDDRDEYPGGDLRTLVISDGTVLTVEYSPDDYSGKWRVIRMKAGTAAFTHEAAKSEDDEYTDRAILVSPNKLSIVSCWKGEDPSERELRDWLEQQELSDLTFKQLKALYALVRESH